MERVAHGTRTRKTPASVLLVGEVRAESFAVSEALIVVDSDQATAAVRRFLAALVPTPHSDRARRARE